MQLPPSKKPEHAIIITDLRRSALGSEVQNLSGLPHIRCKGCRATQDRWERPTPPHWCLYRANIRSAPVPLPLPAHSNGTYLLPHLPTYFQHFSSSADILKGNGLHRPVISSQRHDCEDGHKSALFQHPRPPLHVIMPH